MARTSHARDNLFRPATLAIFPTRPQSEGSHLLIQASVPHGGLYLSARETRSKSLAGIGNRECSVRGFRNTQLQLRNVTLSNVSDMA